jgi:hypothetical protein
MSDEANTLDEVITCLREAIQSATARSGGYQRHFPAIIGDLVFDPNNRGSVPGLTRQQLHAACDAIAADYAGDDDALEMIEDVRGLCDAQLRGRSTVG